MVRIFSSGFCNISLKITTEQMSKTLDQYKQTCGADTDRVSVHTSRRSEGRVLIMLAATFNAPSKCKAPPGDMSTAKDGVDIKK